MNSLPINLVREKSVTTKELQQLKKFRSTVFFDGNLGLFLGFCKTSRVPTSLIFTEQETLMTRNLIDCTFDETFLSRRRLPRLLSYFNSVNLLRDEDTDDLVVRFPRPPIVGAITKPYYFSDVVKHPDRNIWEEAMKKEINMLEQLKSLN